MCCAGWSGSMPRRSKATVPLLYAFTSFTSVRFSRGRTGLSVTAAPLQAGGYGFESVGSTPSQSGFAAAWRLSESAWYSHQYSYPTPC